MPNLILAAVEYGGYISAVKFIVFLVLFFLWLPLVGWVCNDARSVETRYVFWTAVVFGAGVAATIIWMLIPIFIIGMLFFLIFVGAASVSYVSHRNSRVMDYDRVLTAEHIKGLFAGKQKKLDALKSFVFITANNNEVPLPEPRTSDFFGYKAAYDLFNDAMWRRADGIIFVSTPQDCKVVYNIDGAAAKQPSIPREQIEYFFRFIKNVGDLDVKEKRKPQKGKFRIVRNKETIEWEITTAGSTAGEQVRLKRIKTEAVAQLTELGLTAAQQEQLNKLKQLKQGVFIVSGPPKSGVTTTLYSLLRNNDAFINNINTLERQILLELPNITQNLFTRDDSDSTYAKKLQAIVRMGPEIVGVAGCQDTETARVICQAAQDGKIMYVTIEADSVLKTLDRWITSVGEKKLAFESLIGISNQRLLRKLCPECKQAYAPKKELLRKFGLPAEKAKVLYRAGKVQYSKRGKPFTCEHCQGAGFVGRTGVFEMITINEPLREAMKKSESLSDISSKFRGAKMLYLQEQALKKVIEGTTSINEMVRVFTKSGNRKQKNRNQNSK